MLIRVKGGKSGIVDYLVNGQKEGRDFTRDQLDERVILCGDLDLTDAVINGMANDGDKYNHITLAFKEDSVDLEVMLKIVERFERFAMSAYDGDEYNFYAEAHLPKIKSYINRKTGELVERMPHIHIVIPRQNLLSGNLMDPLYKPVYNAKTGLYEVPEGRLKWLDAFQEGINAEFGLASPKDNRRQEFTGESEIISRYKGDLFKPRDRELKERILSDVLDRKISDYESFKALLTEYGATRARNEDKATEYQNVKPADVANGINLKDYVFSREFIEKPEAEKRRFLADEGRRQYESQQPPRKTAPELAATVQEWHEVQAKELKYINSGNRKLYAAYRSADREGKRAILDERAAAFYAKHRKTFTQEQTSNERPHYDRISADRARPGQRAAAVYQSHLAKARRQAAPESLASVRNLSRVGMVHDAGASKVLLQPNAPDRVGRERTADHEVRRARAGDSRAAATAGELNKPAPRDRRQSDSVLGQLAAEQRERGLDAKGAHLSEFAQIKRELDARRLLAHLSKTHGLIPEKYEVTKGKDGGDRIKAGTRNLNVSDFLTQEMRLSFEAEAAPILRQVYAAQQGRELAEARPAPRRELWQAFREAQPLQAKQRAAEWDAQRKGERDRRATIRDEYQAKRRAIQADRSKSGAERKATMSLSRMERVTKDMALRESIRDERQQLKEKHSQPYQARYRAFLAERANQGDENALAELRRQRDASPAPTEPNAIEGTSRKRDDEKVRAAHLARNLAYSIDQAGNVTYYADQAKRRALVIDSGQRVTVAAVEDSQAVETGLRLAVQKFGPGLKIEGNEEFKRQVIDAVLKTGLRVEFDDKAMNDELQRRQAERDELQARGKAFITREREKTASETAAKQATTPAPEKTQEQERTPAPEAPEPQPKPRDIER